MKEKKVAFVSGHFNILHPGHLRLLRYAKDLSDYLIVGVECDAIVNEIPYVSQLERSESLSSIEWIDKVVIIQKNSNEIIKVVRPDIVVKGLEFKYRDNIEQDLLESYGGKLIFGSGEVFFLGSGAANLNNNDSYINNINIPYNYLKRNDINFKNLTELLNGFSDIKVCVIGDLIIDEYISCNPLGMSQEEPSIVVTPVKKDKFIGGAGIVAAHASGLGASVTYITVTGSDSAAEFAKKEMVKNNIEYCFFRDASRPTTVKKRFRSKEKSLLRVNYLKTHDIDDEIQAYFIKKVKGILGKINLIVFSDFNYGCLPQVLVDNIVDLAKEKGVMVVADSQSSSQNGDISRYKNMNLVTPTEYEARSAINNNKDGLIILLNELYKKSNPKNIILKLGEEGVLIYDADGATDRVNALNSNPKDVSGAGDSMLITSSMVLVSGGTIWEASLLGSIASAIQVGRIGNIPLSKIDFMKAFS